MPIDPYRLGEEDDDRPAALGDDVYCGGCGYQLFGLPFVGRCPECGGEYKARGRETGGIYKLEDLVFPLTDCLACTIAGAAMAWLMWGLVHGLEFWLAVATVVFGVVTPLYLRHTWRRLGTWRRGRHIARRVFGHDD